VKPYDVPARSLVAKDVNGLMMAGRNISGDYYAHASYRVVGNAVPLGEAAGTIAAYAALNNILPQDIIKKKYNI
jgi:succinate dehydrogenase/fumarate reductase flavoprotein subunit